MATKKKTTKRKKPNRQAKPADKQTTGHTVPGPAATDASVTRAWDETVPYPSVGDNPAFDQWVGQQTGGTDAAAATGGQADQDKGPKRGPGRPPGTGKHQKAAAVLNEEMAAGLDATIFASVWRGLFNSASIFLNEKALQLTDGEAIALAKPSAVLWSYYMPSQVTPVQAAWSQLGMVLFGVVGTRTAAIERGWRVRQKKAAAGKPKEQKPAEKVAPPPGPAGPDKPAGTVGIPSEKDVEVHWKPKKKSGGKAA